ncbi:MAG: hypothetical protein Salg2KO_10580 [Salibacteraceae bacterium]
MADFDNDIDQIFKSRFDGLRDDSANPSAHWSSVESGLSEPALSSAVTTASSFNIIKIAASIASFAVISSISSDRLAYNENSLIDSLEIAPSELLTPEIEGDEVNPEMAAEFSSLPVDQEEPHLVEEPPSPISTNLVPDNTTLALVGQQYSEPIEDEPFTSMRVDRIADTISTMSQLLYAYESPSIDDPNYAPVNPTIAQWQDDHVWFFRGGARTGVGESNSYAVEAKWAVNPTFAFGYGVALTDRSFMSIEVGLIRRSGNGIERMRQKNIEPEVASFANTANSELSVNIHNGLIATHMDYIHFPLQYNYLATQNWNISVGGFMDYLISARNQSVVVYNSENYIAVTTRSNEVNSLDGLNKFRYGAMAGAERRVTDHFSAYAQVLVPINDPIDQKGGFESFGKTNRLIDGQVGMKYNF